MSVGTHRQDLEALKGVLAGQREVFDTLAELVIEQRRALLTGDESTIEELIDRSQTLATHFQLLEREREALERDAEEQVLEGSEKERGEAAAALQTLLREAAISGVVLSRLGDTVTARRTAIDLIVGGSYLPSGRARSSTRAGQRFSVGG